MNSNERPRGGLSSSIRPVASNNVSRLQGNARMVSPQAQASAGHRNPGSIPRPSQVQGPMLHHPRGQLHRGPVSPGLPRGLSISPMPRQGQGYPPRAGTPSRIPSIQRTPGPVSTPPRLPGPSTVARPGTPMPRALPQRFSTPQPLPTLRQGVAIR